VGRNLIGFVSGSAFFHDEVWRRVAGAMIARCFLPRFRASLQSIKKLAEIVSIDFDVVTFLHISADIPGQVDPIPQVFSRFNFTGKSGSLAAWQKLRL
jgi:hypothetical protein